MVTSSQRPNGPQMEVRTARFCDDGTADGRRYDGAAQITVRAGRRGVERIVPPAGDDHAFEVERWGREVTVYVSPTGRSVRVWVDGAEVTP